ncbi:hypothetical protein Ancab_001941, partial [Ancistrocladus abbreviatus]
GRPEVNQNLSKSDKHRPAGEEWVLKVSNKAKQQVASYANIVAGKWNTGGRPIGGRLVLLSEEKGVPLDKDVGSETLAWDEPSEKIASLRGELVMTDINTKAKTRFDY